MRRNIGRGAVRRDRPFSARGAATPSTAAAGPAVAPAEPALAFSPSAQTPSGAGGVPLAEDTATELASVRPVLRAVARTVVPGARDLDEEGWAELEAIVADALTDRPPAVRRQVGLLLRALQWMPVPRWGRRFTSLSPRRRERVLAVLQDAPLLLLRRGFWGLRTLVLMGYWGRPAAREQAGYDARLRGRLARGEPVSGRGRGELLDVTPRGGGAG